MEMKSEYEEITEMMGVNEVNGVCSQDVRSPILSAREVVEAFGMSRNSVEDGVSDKDQWDFTAHENLEQDMVQFISGNPGKSYSAVFAHFRKEGFSYTDIRETYNVLVYDKKLLQRLNVGTDKSPRYAHFVTGLFAYEPGRDALYEVLGPV